MPASTARRDVALAAVWAATLLGTAASLVWALPQLPVRSLSWRRQGARWRTGQLSASLPQAEGREHAGG